MRDSPYEDLGLPLVNDGIDDCEREPVMTHWSATLLRSPGLP